MMTGGPFGFRDATLFGRPFRWFWPLCAMSLCRTFRPASDENGCWGQCSYCGKRAGYVDRATLRRYADRSAP